MKGTTRPKLVATTWVLLVAVGALMCGVGWALSSPVGSSPDEPYHLASIWCADSDDRSRCEPAGTSEDGKPMVEVPALVAGASCYAFHPEISGECQRTVQGSLITGAVDSGDYPAGFYRVMHVFVGDRVGLSVVTMRVVNVLVAVVLFAVLALNGTPSTRRLQLYALSCTLIPLGWFILASVNPSSWALTGITAFGFALHSLFVVRRRRKLIVNSVVAILATVLGLVARGDAAVYVVIVAVAVCVLHWRTLRTRRILVVVPLICCLLSVIFALSSPQVSGVAGAAAETDRTRQLVLASLGLDFPTLISGMFGYGFGLGWLDTAVHSVTAFSVVLIVGFLAISGAGRGSKSKALAVLLLGGGMMAIPLLTLYRARLIVGESVQPRYLLPLVPVLLALILTGRRPWRSLRLTRVQAAIIATMLTVAQAAAVYANMRRYVTGYDGPVIVENIEWWWSGAPAPITTCILSSIGFAVFVAAIIPLSGRRPVRGPRHLEAAGD